MEEKNKPTVDESALENRCPSCNASIKFNPSVGKFKCEYCGSEFTLEEMKQHNDNASTDEKNKPKEEPKSKDWKPKKGDTYYYIGSVGSIFNYDYREDISDEAHLNIGNYFKTKEDAKHMVEKFKVIRELQKFANENNEKEIDWKNFNQCKYKIVYDAEDEDLYVDYSIQCESEPFNIYFTSFKIAKKAIEAVGEDRIKKYYFNVEEA